MLAAVFAYAESQPTEFVHASDGRELDFAKDGIAEDIREDILDFCKALVLLVVSVEVRINEKSKNKPLKRWRLRMSGRTCR